MDACPSLARQAVVFLSGWCQTTNQSLAIDDIFHCAGEPVEIVDWLLASALSPPVLPRPFAGRFCFLVLFESPCAPGL